MGEIVNLNRFRKQRDRLRKAQEAEENRAKHGLTKAEKVRQKTIRAKEDARLDAHRLKDPPD